jgi:hypothetical protein
MVLLVLTACAVRTSIEPVSPEAAAANRKYENIIFRTVTADNELPNQAEAMVYCLRSAMDHLQAKNVYTRVEKQGAVTYPEPTLFVDLRLIDLRIVSSTARMWGGVYSGRSHMKVNVKLTDTQGAAVAEQELFGAPNAYGSLYSGGRSDVELPQNMGILVGDFVLANTGRK